MTQADNSPTITNPSALRPGPPRSRGLCTLAVIVSVLAAVAYSWFLIDHMATYAGGADSSGYFNSAKLLVYGQSDISVRKIPGLQPPNWNWIYQQPLGFEVNRTTGLMVPTYPVGLPLHLLLASRLVGWAQSATLINVVTALATAMLFWLLARRLGLSRPWAFAGVVLFAACPLFVFFSLQPMSDMPATAWTLAALWSALKSREHRAWSLAAGAAVGMAVLIRPTNLLLMVPVLYVLGLDWRRGVGLALGGLPFAVFLAIYNLRLYGHIFTTGYSNIDSLLGWRFVLHNAAHFAKWIVLLLTPIMLLAPAVAWIRRIPLQVRVLLGLWFGVIVGFYAFYFHSGETWWYLRFILPALPAVIVAALLVTQTLFDRVPSPATRVAVAAVLLVAALVAQIRWNRTLEVTAIARQERAYYDAAHWLRATVAPDSIIVAMQMSGALHYYTDFPLIRYDVIPPEAIARLRQTARQHHQSIYAPLFPFEVPLVVDAHLGGTWKKVGTVSYITIWQLVP